MGPSSKEAARNGSKWTVMVFMSAETVAGFAPLGQAAADDLAEMEAAVGEGVDVFVQLHNDEGAERFQVGRSQERQSVPLVERDHGNGLAISSFVRWVWKHQEGRAAGPTMLVLWGHSYQFAIGHLPKPDGTVDSLDFPELSQALGRLGTPPRGVGLSNKVVDVIGFDCCDLSMIEVAYQLRNHADYLLASEMGIPIPGWPYDRIFDRLVDPKGALMGPGELGSYVVRRYCETYAIQQRAVSLTHVRLAKAAEAAAHVHSLARELAIAVGRSSHTKGVVKDLMSRAQTDSEKPFIDVVAFCAGLARRIDEPSVERVATALGDFLVTPDPVIPGGGASAAGRPLIIEHGRNALRAATLNGLSLYAPHVVGEHDFEAAHEAYRRFEFAEGSFWPELVHNLAASI